MAVRLIFLDGCWSRSNSDKVHGPFSQMVKGQKIEASGASVLILNAEARTITDMNRVIVFIGYLSMHGSVFTTMSQKLINRRKRQ